MNFVTVNIPVLETERLILRGFEERDMDAYAAIRADDVVTTFVGGSQPRYLVWRSVTSIIGQWAWRGFSFFCVEEKSSGDCIGSVGPYYPDGWPEPEIGWTLAKSAQGKGYATEAGRAALSFAYRDLGWKTAISVIDADNHPSQNVAKKLGATLETSGQSIWDFTADIWRHLPPDEFFKSNPSTS
ncbi:MAG: GNAT family N-acetyltransferase [Pseudomonadota bacterium]